MKTKEEIVSNWLVRYTGVPLEDFGQYILLTNFQHYVDIFAELTGAEINGKGKSMTCATNKGITIINFGMGSPNAATVMDLLSAIGPKAVLFLGKCGGLKKRNNIGDLILPIGAIRGESTSNDYFPPEVPAMPSFALQKAVSTTIRDQKVDYWTGTVYTTNLPVDCSRACCTNPNCSLWSWYNNSNDASTHPAPTRPAGDGAPPYR